MSYLIVGLGKSGVGSAKLLEVKKEGFAFYDSSKTAIKPEDFENRTLYYDSITDEELSSFEGLIVSPGVPTEIGIVSRAKNLGLEVIGEIELAYRHTKGEIIGITGTNGKTTTTSLVGKIIEEEQSCAVVGNIGNAMTSSVLYYSNDTVYVAELSSFQLETVVDFRPKVAAILNITPDHLDRHHTMEAYAKAKFNIAKNMQKEDILILNADCENIARYLPKIKARIIYFSLDERVDGAYLSQGGLYFRDERIIEVRDVKVLGRHNLANILAAIAITKIYGISSKVICNVISRFYGVEHRLEFVATIGDVDYYNDSKATNPDAAVFGIEAMNRPTILIAGGYDKGANYDSWLEIAKEKTKLLILLGDTKENIYKSAKLVGIENIKLVDTIIEAVKLAKRYAKIGDAVLLSPACASWDQYENFELRGRDFKSSVVN